MQASDFIDGKDDFVVFTPGLEVLEKSIPEGMDIEAVRPIGGFCSTERLDRQEEVVLAKGLDFSEFVQYGWYNDNHKQDTAAVLGAPRTAYLVKSRWRTEGNLLVGYQPADQIWALAKAMQKSAVIDRSLGFSIEGKIKERDHENRILKAIIRNVAITAAPVNVDCSWSILTKAFSPLNLDAIKAVAAGTQGPRHAGGAALQPESVEREPIDLSFDAAVERLKKSRPGYSWSACERLARLIFQLETRRH